ncbi:hypothetical protein EOI86_02240 [Hwanghaeella grinnelliae]|uniref:Uncharacterized protein n=1 Tax=Hwanghaeella grinnelliae TaxID=2500179 RepID=A0A437QUG5_9PROT|nr:hypothetical protein [Hwanghaeella grinnelliae]RVU38143.1 hypothetical protein EOI86_02240 [Hwanghaeella grinnelliae]
MSNIQSGISLSDPRVRVIDTSKLKRYSVAEGSEEAFRDFVSGQEGFLKARHADYSGVSSHPGYRPYARVVVGGKTVATIDNFGGVQSSNAMGGKIRPALEAADRKSAGQQGPAAALARAEEIARQLGGKVAMASTAMTQSEFNATPAPQVTVNQAALQNDPMYEQLQKLKQARSAFLAQQQAQEEV